MNDDLVRVTRRQWLAAAGAFGLALLGSPASAKQGCEAPPHAPPVFTFHLKNEPGVTSGPVSVVDLIEVNGQLQYRVAGQPQTIRGMGYNPRLSGRAPLERAIVLARDFALMRSAGVNTVFGWDPVEFDAQLLDAAFNAGLGVAIPYDIDFEADARDPEVRARMRSELRSQIRQFAQHPATRIWAVGNEVLQRTVPPDWCGASLSPDLSARSEALASLIVELADLAHQEDPNHPVVYRESEDSYLSWIEQALRDTPAERPWLIYGINAYTGRLVEILDAWTQREVSRAVFVSEFGQVEGTRGQRAGPLLETWNVIRARSAYVIGGAAYVWYTDGPEDVDQHHGFVGLNGEPVDDALEALGAAYRAETDS